MEERCSWRWALVGVALLILTGCGPAEFASVSGTVTMDGKPLKEAHVWFVMEGKRDALGVTDDEGRYEVVSSRTQAGAPIGLNKVRIETSLWNNAGIPIKGAIIVPEKYRDPAKTELSAEVKAGANTFDFDLVGGKIQQ